MKGCSLVSPVFTLTPSIIHREHQGALECVPAVHSSCVQVYSCVIQLFAYASQPLYTRALYVNIPSVSLSTLCPTCACGLNVCAVCMKCVFCMQVVCTCNVSSSSCPSGAAMWCCSASSLIAPISLWFAVSYSHTHTQMYTLAYEYTHTYLRS